MTAPRASPVPRRAQAATVLPGAGGKGRAAIRAAATALLLVAVAGAPARAEPPRLRILDAQYGDAQTSRLCDATAAVAALCDGQGACTVQVGNALCGDPAFGTPKRLQMAFKCEGSVPELLIAPEPNVVRLACPGVPDPLHQT